MTASGGIFQGSGLFPVGDTLEAWYLYSDGTVLSSTPLTSTKQLTTALDGPTPLPGFTVSGTCKDVVYKVKDDVLLSDVVDEMLIYPKCSILACSITRLVLGINRFLVRLSVERRRPSRLEAGRWWLFFLTTTFYILSSPSVSGLSLYIKT